MILSPGRRSWAFAACEVFSNKTDDARKTITETLPSVPKQFDAYFWLGSLYVNMQDFASAKAILAQTSEFASSIDQKNKVLPLLFLSAVRSNNITTAKTLEEQVASILPSNEHDVLFEARTQPLRCADA